MSDSKMSNGKWVVLALLAMGIIAALAGWKFREMPRDDGPAATRAITK
jgi:hypothetical protein